MTDAVRQQATRRLGHDKLGYATFAPRPDDQELEDQQTSFFESDHAGASVILGGNGAGCLGAEQAVYDPVQKRHRIVSEIDSDFHVYALNSAGERVIAKAEQPRVYGRESLAEWRLSDGSKFTATLGHKVLSKGGEWKELGDLAKTYLPKLKGSKGGDVEIVNCRFLREDEYWDFHVPVHENYELAGVWHHNTTTLAVMKLCRFLLETPAPRPDTPAWFIAKSYDQVTKVVWKEKIWLGGAIPEEMFDWNRASWYKSKERLPYTMPLKPDEHGNNWSLEFKSYEQGIGQMMASAIGAFCFVEQFPWVLLEEVLRGCREYSFTGNKVIEFTPVVPELSLELEEMIQNGEAPEKPEDRDKNAMYLPSDWGIYYANTLAGLKHGHVDPVWFEQFYGMMTDEMIEVRQKGKFASYEGVIYKGFNPHTHVIGDEIWLRMKDAYHYRGLDWGAGPHNAFACVWVARNNNGQYFVYHEYESTDQTYTVVDHLCDIQKEWDWPEHDLFHKGTYCDPSDPSNIRVAQKLHMYTASRDDADEIKPMVIHRARNAVFEGITHVQHLLKPQIKVIDADTGEVRLEPKLFIYKNCKRLIRCLKTYRWKKDAAFSNQTNPQHVRVEPLKLNDHLCDALRYGTFSPDSHLGITIDSAASRRTMEGQDYFPEYGTASAGGVTDRFQHRSNQAKGRG